MQEQLKVGDIVVFSERYFEEVSRSSHPTAYPYQITAIFQPSVHITTLKRDRTGFIDGVAERPYWVSVVEYAQKPELETIEGIWIGYFKLDPFLGQARRAAYAKV